MKRVTMISWIADCELHYFAGNSLYFELKCCQLSIRKESFNLEIRVVDHIFIWLWEITENIF